MGGNMVTRKNKDKLVEWKASVDTAGTSEWYLSANLKGKFLL